MEQHSATKGSNVLIELHWPSPLWISDSTTLHALSRRFFQMCRGGNPPWLLDSQEYPPIKWFCSKPASLSFDGVACAWHPAQDFIAAVPAAPSTAPRLAGLHVPSSSSKFLDLLGNICLPRIGTGSISPEAAAPCCLAPATSAAWRRKCSELGGAEASSQGFTEVLYGRSESTCMRLTESHTPGSISPSTSLLFSTPTCRSNHPTLLACGTTCETAGSAMLHGTKEESGSTWNSKSDEPKACGRSSLLLSALSTMPPPTSSEGWIRCLESAIGWTSSNACSDWWALWWFKAALCSGTASSVPISQGCSEYLVSSSASIKTLLLSAAAWFSFAIFPCMNRGV